MKYLAIISAIIIFLLLTVIFVGLSEMSRINRVQQSEIEGLRIQADSLKGVIKLKDDTIRIAKNTIILQADTIKNDKQAKENFKRNVHDQIHFIDLRTDARRDSTLSILYPSFSPVR